MNELPIPDPIKVEANPAFVRILRMARDRLWDGVSPRNGRDTFICLVVLSAAGYSLDTKVLTESITLRLKGRRRAEVSDYEDWLRRRKIHWHTREQLQAARLRWIDQMIQEYEGARLIQKRPVLSFRL